MSEAAATDPFGIRNKKPDPFGIRVSAAADPFGIRGGATLPAEQKTPRRFGLPGFELNAAVAESLAQPQPTKIPTEKFGNWGEDIPTVDPLVQAMTQNLPERTSEKSIKGFAQNIIRDIGELPTIPIQMAQHPVEAAAGLVQFPMEQARLLSAGMQPWAPGHEEALEDLYQSPMAPLFAAGMAKGGYRGLQKWAPKVEGMLTKAKPLAAVSREPLAVSENIVAPEAMPVEKPKAKPKVKVEAPVEVPPDATLKVANAPTEVAAAKTALPKPIVEGAKPAAKEPWEMTRGEFIENNRNKFVKEKGKRIFRGIQARESTIYPLPKGAQKDGKLIKSVDEILSEIHRDIIKGRTEQYQRGLTPYATPLEKGVKPVPAEVLADYPDLAKGAGVAEPQITQIKKVVKGEAETAKAPAPEPVKGEVAAKQPWEMTNIEYTNYKLGESKNLSYKDMAGKIDTFQKSFAPQHKKEILAALSDGKDVPAEVLADYPELAKGAGVAEPQMAQMAQIKKGVEGAKQPWEMRWNDANNKKPKSYPENNYFTSDKSELSGYRRINTKQAKQDPRVNVTEWHEAVIIDAINEGKPVPVEVLADYPDLAKAAADYPELAKETKAEKPEAKVETPKMEEQYDPLVAIAQNMNISAEAKRRINTLADKKNLSVADLKDSQKGLEIKISGDPWAAYDFALANSKVEWEEPHFKSNFKKIAKFIDDEWGVTRRRNKLQTAPAPEPVQAAGVAEPQITQIKKGVAGAKTAKAPAPEPAKGEVAAKQPWEMTREEFNNEAIYRGVPEWNLKGDNTYWTQNYERARKYAENLGIDQSPRARAKGVIRVSLKKNIPEELIGIEGDKTSLNEYLDYVDSGVNMRDGIVTSKTSRIKVEAEVPLGADPHRHIIETALSDGKTVPDAVLADYPELLNKEIATSSDGQRIPRNDAGEIYLHSGVDVLQPLRGAAEKVKGTRRYQRAQESAKRFQTWFLEGAENYEIRVKDLIERPEVKISDVTDPYLKSTLMVKRVENNIHRMEKEVYGVLKEMKAEGVTQKEIHQYLHYQHAPYYNKRLYDGAAGITTAEAASNLNRMRKSANYGAVERHARHFEEKSHEALEILYDGGVITKELYQKLQEIYPHHVPLYRVTGGIEELVAELTNAAAQHGSKDVKSAGIRAAEGGSRQVDNIPANIIYHYQQAVKLAERNAVDQTWLQMVRDNEDLFGQTQWGMGGLFEIKSPKAVGRTFDKKRLLFEKTAAPQILQFRAQGKPVWMKINDPKLAVAMRGTNRDVLPKFLRPVALLTRYYAMLQTRYNLDFFIPNKIRDLPEAAVYLAAMPKMGLKGAAKMVAHDLKSGVDVMMDVFGKDTKGARYYQELKELGGAGGGGMALSTRKNIEMTLEKMDKLLHSPTRRGIHNLIEFIDKVNTIFEDSTRLSVYKAARERGIPQARAAYMAKEASINFDRHGRWTPIANSLYMFSKASVLGTTKMLRSFKNPRVLGGTVLTVATAVGTVNTWNDYIDPDWREKVSKWDRLNGLPIVIPSWDDKFRYFTFPSGWGLKPIKVWADVCYDLATGIDVDVEKALSLTLSAIWDSYNPVGGTSLEQSLIPSVWRPIEDRRANQSWTGRKIKPDWDPDMPEDMRYFSSLEKTGTGRAAISLAEMLQEETGLTVSPADMTYIAESYMGGAGRFTKKTANTLSGIISGKMPPADEFPIFNRFYDELEADEVQQGSPEILERRKENLQDETRVAMKRKQEAKRIDERLQTMSKPEMAKELKRIKTSDPKLYEDLTEVVLDRTLGRTYEDKLLMRMGVENGQRAREILKTLAEMKTAAEKREYIKDLKRKKVITEKVEKQMVILLNRKPGTGNWEP